YDYTDFVEGLRPKQVDGSDQIGFERRDGVFKVFCEKALRESYRENSDNVDNFEECWDKLVDELNENDFAIIPLISGKGDFRVELNEYGTGLANRTYENDDYQKGNWIQGKSKFFSKDQLYNIYQGLPGTPAGGHDNYRKAVVEYMKKNLGLLDYRKTESTEKIKKNFVFIIDEINRGEVAKIFGELFYCIDPGYRGEKGRISTQYQNLVTSGEFQKGFFIPENVYIIGTMNDIDRSVESMDFAFRRRFSWIEVKASDTVDMLDSELSAELAEEAKKRMIRLNKAIWNEKENKGIEGLNEAYHIGASYFLKLKNYNGNFESLWEYHIKGILQEYLRGSGNEAKIAELKAAYDREEEN
ncbi:MAG: AAA family ATPase, partial [Treponemataceae bacterium]|nr:AAA family ATPase [Treponemataceae bacterium]